MNVSLSALNALATHLEIVSKTARSHGGHGWTYDEEIQLIRDTAEELKELRKRLRYLDGTSACQRKSPPAQRPPNNAVRQSSCGLARGTRDWYVIDCPDDVSQPEGTRAEFLELLASLRARTSATVGKRLAVSFLPDGSALFYSLRNCSGSPDDMVTIPAAGLPAWIAHAEKVLG